MRQKKRDRGINISDVKNMSLLDNEKYNPTARETAGLLYIALSTIAITPCVSFYLARDTAYSTARHVRDGFGYMRNLLKPSKPNSQ